MFLMGMLYLSLKIATVHRRKPTTSHLKRKNMGSQRKKTIKAGPIKRNTCKMANPGAPKMSNRETRIRTSASLKSPLNVWSVVHVLCFNYPTINRRFTHVTRTDSLNKELSIDVFGLNNNLIVVAIQLATYCIKSPKIQRSSAHALVQILPNPTQQTIT